MPDDETPVPVPILSIVPTPVDAASELRERMQKALNTSNLEVRRNMQGEALVQYLRRVGQGFVVGGDDHRAVYVDGTTGCAWNVRDRVFLTQLAERAGVAAGGRDFEATCRGAVEKVCFAPPDGVPVKGRLVGLSAIGPDRKLYLRKSATEIFRVGDGEIGIVPNGYENLILQLMPEFAPIPDDLPAPIDNWCALGAWGSILTEYVYEDLNPQAAAELLALNAATMLLPSELLPARPMLFLVGPAKVGKTTLAHILTNFVLSGVRAQPPPGPHEANSFETVCARRVVMAVDDVHEAASWLPTFLRAVATGADRTRRALYTDDELFELRFDARFVFTANELPHWWQSEADISRLIPIRLMRRSTALGYLPDGTQENRAQALRLQFWSSILHAFTRTSFNSAGVLRQRMSAWAGAMQAIAQARDASGALLDVVSGTLDRLDHVRAAMTVEENQVANGISQLAAARNAQAGRVFWMGTASRLLEDLRRLDRHIWTSWTPVKIGCQLRAISESLTSAYDIRLEMLPRTKSSRVFALSRIAS